MSRKLVLFLATGLLLLPAAPTSARPAGSFETFFCPECWVYLFGAGSTDMKGNCAACGKYPVELEARSVEWWWCLRQEKWLQAPCPQTAARHCCSGDKSLALAGYPGPDVFHAWYCPAHGTFDGIKLPILGIQMCGTCGRPAVKVQATRRAWYWCELEGVWASEPCPLNPARNCCGKYQGMLLVKSEPRPMARK